MRPITDQILTVAQMRAAEDELIAGGDSVDSLMRKAGGGAANWIWRIAGRSPVTVLCGPGNNGGDGYVIAETLRAQGVLVKVVAPLEPVTKAARNARSAFQGDVVTSEEGCKGLVFVDCLFGSGVTRPLSRELQSVLRNLAESHRISVAVDLPSGVDSDTGLQLNSDLPRYRLTIALGAWKRAHWLMPASAQMGTRRLVDIGVAKRGSQVNLLAKPRLEAPHTDSHKYSRGLLAVVGGSMPGASILAAKAAMHGGAGYVRLLSLDPASVPAELVSDHRPLREGLSDPRIDTMLAGPGLGRDDRSLERLRNVLSLDRPTVIDADALMFVSPDLIRQRKAPLIATPHEGELSRLREVYSINISNRMDSVRELSRISGMVVVAKGPDTLIAAPDGGVVIAPPASSWLSTAGTGDVLAGIIASRLATGEAAMKAASQAVWLHAEAARRAGPVFTAGELAAQLPKAYAACL